MVNEEHFKTEKYRFYFSQARERVLVRKKPSVVVDIVPIEVRRKVTDEDLRELKEFFNDMGKWENFVKAGKDLLRDLGVPIEVENEEKREFGVEKYESQLTKTEDSESIMVTMNLTAKEGLRRTKGSTEHAMLPIEEISEQLKNVPKWQTLKKTMLELKEKL